MAESVSWSVHSMAAWLLVQPRDCTSHLAPCRDLATSEVVFASVAGLRGSVSLIMAQAFVTESATATAEARVCHSCPCLCILLQLLLMFTVQHYQHAYGMSQIYCD